MNTSENIQEIAGYVTVGRAAAMLGVSEQLVRKLIASGELEAERVGDNQHVWLIRKMSVEARKGEHPKRRGPAKGQGGRPKKAN